MMQKAKSCCNDVYMIKMPTLNLGDEKVFLFTSSAQEEQQIVF